MPTYDTDFKNIPAKIPSSDAKTASLPQEFKSRSALICHDAHGQKVTVYLENAPDYRRGSIGVVKQGIMVSAEGQAKKVMVKVYSRGTANTENARVNGKNWLKKTDKRRKTR